MSSIPRLAKGACNIYFCTRFYKIQNKNWARHLMQWRFWVVFEGTLVRVSVGTPTVETEFSWSALFHPVVLFVPGNKSGRTEEDQDKASLWAVGIPAGVHSVSWVQLRSYGLENQNTASGIRRAHNRVLMAVNEKIIAWCCVHWFESKQVSRNRVTAFSVLLGCFLTWLSLHPWRWRQYFPPKRHSTCSRLQNIISYNLTNKYNIFRICT
jgi:hypothetical protein